MDSDNRFRIFPKQRTLNYRLRVVPKISARQTSEHTHTQKRARARLGGYVARMVLASRASPEFRATSALRPLSLLFFVETRDYSHSTK